MIFIFTTALSHKQLLLWMKPLSNLSKFIQLSSRVRRRRQWHPTQYSCLENPMDRGAWWAAVHWVAKSWTQLSNFTCTFHFHALEKAMATHSRVLAWKIPGMEEPVGLPSVGSHRVGHDWCDLAAAAELGLKQPGPIAHTFNYWMLPLGFSFTV